MKNTTGYYKNIIFLFVLFAFIKQPVISQSFIVDGIDLMEGFTFGAAAEEINTTGYNVWTVTNTNDNVFDAEQGSLRWAVEQVNKDDYKAQDNYIHFDIPGDGPHIISLETELPEIKGNVVIDGEVLKGNEPDIIIECKKLTSSLFSKGQVVYLNNWDANSYFHLQGIKIRNSDSPIFINRAETIKIFSNIIFHEKDVEIEGGDKMHISSQRGNKNVLDLKMQGNFIGSDLNIDTNYTIFNRGFFIYQNQTDRTYNYKIGGANLNERNVFVNCNYGLDISTFPFVSAQNNFFYNIKDGYRGYKTTTKLSENLFYQCTDAIKYNSSYTNPDAYSPLIDAIFFSGNELYIKGRSQNNRSGETIEVFLGTSECTEDAIKYLGSVVSEANGEWELSSGSSGWADPSFIPQGGDVLLATSTYSGQTSDFSDTAAISCIPASLVVNNPAPACETDLTHPAIIQGSTGGNDVLIPHSGLVTEDPTNSTSHFTDMTWWGDEDGPQAIIDNDETTSWRARPRNNKLNYFIIDMQAMHDISTIEIMSGDETFTDGVCEVYIADWQDNPGDYRIENLSWTKAAEFGPVEANTTQSIPFNGEAARFIRFQLTTTIDKDYWKINEINIHKHQFSFYQDAGASIPLTNPEHITHSGTYYIKMGHGTCADIKPVEVTIDPVLCTGCPCNISITNPEPACSVDLTSASITAGTKGGSNELIDKQGFVTENHTNSGNIYTDMTWWDEKGHPVAMTDNNEETYWHAQPRANQTNYFIINMQEVHEISRIEILSGDHVFNEGVCEIYTACWNGPPYTIETLQWKKTGQFAPVSKNAVKAINFRGDSAQFIKFRLTTGIDKDYWDIREVNIFRHAFTVYEDAAAIMPLAAPESITTSGTYYIKSGEPPCADIRPVEVTTDPALCTPSCSLVVKDPEPTYEYVDLTDPALREGTSGNGHGLMDNSSFTCPANLSDLDWWDDADGLQGMLDNDPGTYFHAQARSYNTNYFTIDMQKVQPVGEIDITSGWNVFDEGTCKVYLSKDNTHWTKAAEFGPIYINSTQNIKIYGIEARYIKFELSTTVDKDYWDITGINIYKHEYSYWKNAAADDPLERPDSVTRSGTYFIKLKAGTSKDTKSLKADVPDCAPAQPSNGQNYILTQTPLKEMKTIQHDGICGEVLEHITYYDGLGRPVQEIAVNASPAYNDIVIPHQYDQYGRESTTYLPFTTMHMEASNNGKHLHNVWLEREYFYTTQRPGIPYFEYDHDKSPHSDYAYAKTGYDNSPLNRVIEKGMPGEPWHFDEDNTGSNGYTNKHTIKTQYTFNEADEVILWTVDEIILWPPILWPPISWTVSEYVCKNEGYYNRGTLYKTIIKNENWEEGDGVINTTEEFKDKSGKVILKRTYTNSETLSTYYVYDDMELLRYVIPPKATKQLQQQGITIFMPGTDIARELCYYYRYDERRRIIEKGIPGAASVFRYVYDNRDRLVLSQDGNQRREGKWLFTKYDALNRPVMTGIIHDSRDITTIRNEAAAYHQLPGKKLYEERGSTVHGYTCRSYPFTATNPTDYHTITYYDDYSIVDQWPAEYQYSSPGGDFEAGHFERVKGLVTATKTRILKTNGFLFTIHYYDEKYNLIQTLSENHMGGYERISMQYDFRGKVLKEVTEHHVDKDADGSLETTTLAQRYEYDHAERLENTWHQVNNESEILLSLLQYNELGQMAQKHLHSTDNGNSFLQTVDYDYNIRGWLTSVNNPDNLGDDLFAMRLHYNEPIYGLPMSHPVSPVHDPDPQYNGNISGMEWKTSPGGTDDQEIHRGYSYFYTPLNNLKFASYGEYHDDAWASRSKFSTFYSYDLNGNIVELGRMDNNNSFLDLMRPQYQGNQLVKADEHSWGNKNEGFMDQASLDEEYLYDANGNMTDDYNKGLQHIMYNYLNLPERFIAPGGALVNNTYDAAGNKLSFTINNGTTLQGREYIGNFIYNMQFNAGVYNYGLIQIHTPEGRLIQRSDGTYRYEYTLTDHLGNARVSFIDNDADGTPELIQEDHYYPFGMQMPGLHYAGGGTPENKYLYNGKELVDDEGIDWYDYGARFYMPDLGRFISIDPLANYNVHLSPFIYSFNNPIRYIDKNGNLSSDVTNKAKSFIGTWYEFGGKTPYYIGGNEVSKTHAYWTSQMIHTGYKQTGFSYSFYEKSSVYAFNFINVPIGYSMGIDCSGLSRIAFNADLDKQMSNLPNGAHYQMNAFIEAKEKGTGLLHSDFNQLKEGDLVFDTEKRTNKEGEEYDRATHVMIATGKVDRDKDGNVTEIEIIHAPGKGKRVKTEMINVAGHLKLGHRHRDGDLVMGTKVAIERDPESMSLNEFYNWVTRNNLWDKVK